jgi:hypothetical protein
MSKGVDVYTFLTDGRPVSATVDGANQNFSSSYQYGNPWQPEVNSWYSGEVSWSASAGGNVFAQSSVDVSGVTGNCSGPMEKMLDTRSLITTQGAVSYGLYDAGQGTANLTNRYQLYVYYTDPYTNWMTQLAASVNGFGDQPFSAWALPGSHDAGMFDPTALKNSYLLLGAEAFFATGATTGVLLLLPVVGQVLAAVLGTLGAYSLLNGPRIAINFAFTQKDNIVTQLNLGARFFDFRPGFNYGPLLQVDSTNLYHQHAVIPGYGFAPFLKDVMNWLAANTGEIVVIDNNSQGFASADMIPPPATITAEVATQQAASSYRGAIGSESDLARSYNDLVSSNTRLILVQDTDKYDSYNTNYSTTNPSTIVAQLSAMNRTGQAGKQFTVLQMQATSTNLSDVDNASFWTLSDASSPLLATKPSIDAATNPWLCQNVLNNLGNSQLVVFLNDFVDNCMVSSAINVTRQRLQSIIQQLSKTAT